MSMVNTLITKQPFKLIEIPLNKFRDEAIPHHQRLYESHKSTVAQLIAAKKKDQLQREFKDKKRIIRQLRDLMYELDTLQTQVEECDLEKFMTNTLGLRKTIIELIKNYANLEKQTLSTIDHDTEQTASSENPLEGAPQIQMQENLSEIKLKETEEQLHKVEALHKDIEDVHGIFKDLSEMTAEQKEQVERIEVNAEVASENVSGGLRQLIKASKLSKASYPITGAFIGSVIGGPVGSIAGLKIGALAAIGGCLAGYVSGKFVKKINDNETSKLEEDLSANLNETEPAPDRKKDI